MAIKPAILLIKSCLLGSSLLALWTSTALAGPVGLLGLFGARPDGAPPMALDALESNGCTVRREGPVHGAGGNRRTDVRRRGYTIRYTGDHAVYDSRIGTNKNLRSDDHADGDPLDSDRFPVVHRAR